MATATPDRARGLETTGNSDPGDRCVAAFCSPRFPELFHAFAYATDIWKQDPFDVKSIHGDAREKFRRIVDRVLDPTGLASGRLLLLLGESGCGKTHLMRAFRNQVHTQGSGYCAYLQMTAFTGHYARYVLNNLVDSLDKPYDDSQSSSTGMMRLSNALAASCHIVPGDRLEQLREGGLDQESIDRLIGEMADSILLEDRFNTIDVYLVQAMLYLQCNDPRIKARVLKYLRCEDLTVHDRRLLGNIVPSTYEDAPPWIIQRLGQLMWAVARAPLILCVDQLEDVFDLEEAAIKFRRAMATLCDIVSRIPSAIVVIACLDNFYEELKKLLTRPIVDRVENDPPPVGLQSPCNREEVERLISQRLTFLYKSMDAALKVDQPTYPLPEALVGTLVGMRARDVLSHVQVYRERCIEKGKMAEFPFSTGIAVPVSRGLESEITSIEQAWNEFRSTFTTEVSVDEPELAVILTGAVRSCSDEVESDEHFEAEVDSRMITVEYHADGQSTARLLVGICNKRAQGGGLSRQIEEVVLKAGERTPVIVRSTDYPSNPKAVVSQQIGRLITGGGRRVVVEDSDWRAMIAFSSFHKQHSADPGFPSWLERTRPLTSLKSLRAILNLDHRDEPRLWAPRADDAGDLDSVSPPPCQLILLPKRLLKRLDAHCWYDQRPTRLAGEDRAR